MARAAAPAAKSAGRGILSKQFAELAGAPIIIHTLRKFAKSSLVDEIYVAVRKLDADRFQSRLDKERFQKKIHLVEGGDNRQQSVGNALATVKAAPEDIVLVHDAVRPLVEEQIIAGVIAAAAKHGAAIAAVPAVDTVKQVDRTAEGAVITSTIPRERVVMAQTPQGFRFRILKSAFDAAQADGFMGTDEASLVERAGHEVAVVMGSPRNIKITTPADLELADFLLAQETRRRASLSG